MKTQELSMCTFCGEVKPVNRFYIGIKNKHFNDNEKGKYNDFFYYCSDCGIKTGEISDGYHTFEELYEFRKIYNAALFNEWTKQGKYEVHKSKKHFDGEDCFGGGWFIVVAVLPTGQISNHYKMEDWNLFECEETEKAKYEFDGHTTEDVIDRLLRLKKYV